MNSTSLLFDLTACQPVGNTLNHGGKEYAEAVFYELMRNKIRLAGFYDSKTQLNEEFAKYCAENGGLFDMNEISLQEVLTTYQFPAFYSSCPYFYDNIEWGKTIFIGNIHGLRSIEVYTDDNECLYAITLKKKFIARIKKFSIVRKWKIKKDRERIGRILSLPNFVCITGSFHSKYAICANYPSYDPDKIFVYFDPLIIDDSAFEGQINDIAGQKYYLLVSGNRWVKNTYRGIMALDELITTGQYKGKVVVTGITADFPYLKKVRNKDNFIFKGYVQTSELTYLYKNAYCLLFLSLSEGFGYPPLESISRGVPVICSPNTALYEIYKEGVLYCNPYSVLDIKTKVLEMENSEIRDLYIKEGTIRAEEIIELQNKDLGKLADFIASFSCSKKLLEDS